MALAHGKKTKMDRLIDRPRENIEDKIMQRNGSSEQEKQNWRWGISF